MLDSVSNPFVIPSTLLTSRSFPLHATDFSSLISAISFHDEFVYNMRFLKKALARALLSYEEM